MDTGASKAKEAAVLALVVVTTFLVLLLGLLVAGLLRSHADILRSLHELGVGVGDPASGSRNPEGGAGTGPVPIDLAPSGAPALGPAPAVAGLTPDGNAAAFAPDNSDRLTLLGFLSSGCTSCAGFWRAFGQPEQLRLPDGTRVVIVTKGPELEITAQVQAMATGNVPVIMSTEAWHDYQVPGSPFFVLVDGASGRKVGQGVANHVSQLVELVRRAEIDGASGAHRSRRAAPTTGLVGVDGPGREAAADEVLQAAGILPGDPSLYPQSLDDVFPLAPTDRRAG